MFAKNLCIFSRSDIDQLKFYFDQHHPDKLLTIPILPSEMIYLAFNNVIDCPEENCERYTKKFEKLCYGDAAEDKLLRMTFVNNTVCQFCKRRRVDTENQLSPKCFVILDLRIEDSSNCGLLPNIVKLDNNDFEDSNFAEKITERFIFEKEKCHFVLITSETEEFFRYEEIFYKENIEQLSKKEILPTRVSKIICEDEINKIKGFLAEKKLKEYDLYKKITKYFIKKNYPYVSFAYGGFKDIHNTSVPLLSHGADCYLCKKNHKANNRKYSLKKDNPRELFLKKKQDYRKSMIVSGSRNFDISIMPTTNLVVLDPLSNNYTLIKTNYTFEDVMEIVNNKNYKVFNCKSLNYKNIQLKCSLKTKQVLSSLSNEDIIIIQSDYDEANEETNYVLIEKIFFRNVISVQRRKDRKNSIVLAFTSFTHEKAFIELELENDLEAKIFSDFIKNYSENIS